MRFPSPLLPGRLVRRYQRFLADVRLDDGSTVTAHCPNPGSMMGLLRRDARVLLTESDAPARRLRHTWELVRVGRTWAGINTMRTNRVVEEALRRRRLAELRGYAGIRPEAPLGERRRADFLLTGDGRRCWVEVKNVTLAEGATALFPDAVTERGTAHLRELLARVREGDRAVMLYLVNRGDCERAGPAEAIDPVYAETLREAVAGGVEAIAYRARAGRRGIRIERRIPFVTSACPSPLLG
jgi:sugar fermentation stimulation protein A